MESSGRLPDGSEIYENPVGEVPDANLDWPIARKFHGLLRTRRENPNTVVDLGPDLGELHISDIDGARADDEEGKLKVYIRQAGEHKKVVGVVIAAGVVIGGLAALKYKKR